MNFFDLRKKIHMVGKHEIPTNIENETIIFKLLHGIKRFNLSFHNNFF